MWSMLYVIMITLIAFVLVFLVYLPQLQKNTSDSQNHKSNKFANLKQLVKNISCIFSLPLEQHYAERIASGDAVFVKGNNIKADVSIAAKIMLLMLVTITVVLLLFDDYVLRALMDIGFIACLDEHLEFSYVVTSIIFFCMNFKIITNLKESINSIKIGRKTGWNGDITKQEYADKVVLKYNKSIEYDHFLRILLSIVFICLMCSMSYVSFLSSIYDIYISQQTMYQCFIVD